MTEIPPKSQKMTKVPPMPEKGGKPLDYLNNTKIALIRKNDHIALVTTKNVQNTPDTEKKTNALQKKEKKKKKRPNYL